MTCDAPCDTVYDRDALDGESLLLERVSRNDFLLAAARRVERIRALLAARMLDACYVRDLSNIKWASAFVGVFDDEPAHALLITQDRAVIHTDSRYVSALERAAFGSIFEISTEAISHAKWLVGMLAEDGDAAASHPESTLTGEDPCMVRVVIEDTLTLREFHELKTANDDASCGIEFTCEQGLIEGLRSVKDDLEIALMRKAQSITDAAFSFIVSFIEPGMTEVQVQRALDTFMLEQGASGLAFPTIVASGAHAASPHAIPDDTPLAIGDAVVMDFGARFAGYCSDMTRTVFIGEPSETLRAAYEAIREANESCEIALQAGKTGAEVHAHAEDILAARGFEKKMGHGLGHSLGIDIHEDPSLAPRNKEPLEAGAVLTVEPGIYLPGEFGMRLEDFGVVTETGFEVITQSTHEMVIIDPLSR